MISIGVVGVFLSASDGVISSSRGAIIYSTWLSTRKSNENLNAKEQEDERRYDANECSNFLLLPVED